MLQKSSAKTPGFLSVCFLGRRLTGTKKATEKKVPVASLEESLPANRANLLMMRPASSARRFAYQKYYAPKSRFDVSFGTVEPAYFDPGHGGRGQRS